MHLLSACRIAATSFRTRSVQIALRGAKARDLIEEALTLGLAQAQQRDGLVESLWAGQTRVERGRLRGRRRIMPYCEEFITVLVSRDPT